MKILKRILVSLVLICILLFVLNMTIAKNLIIFEYSNTYLICTIIVSGSLLICLKIIRQKKKVISIITAIACLVMTFLSCFIFIGVSHSLHRNPQYYDVDINNLPGNYEIVLYEYSPFRGKSGCLCIKVNDFIYKKIPGTHYTIESGHSLVEPGNLILDYDSETEVLTMKYTFGTGSEYIENTTTFFSNK